MWFFKSKEDKREARLEAMRLKNEEYRIKAERLKLKNNISNYKGSMDRRKITQKIAEINDLTELKEYVNELFPEKKNEFLELLENPLVLSLIAQLFKLPPAQKQEKIGELLSQLPQKLINEVSQKIE